MKDLPAHAGDVGSIPGLGNPLATHYSGHSYLGNFGDRETCQVIAHGVTKESDMA